MDAALGESLLEGTWTNGSITALRFEGGKITGTYNGAPVGVTEDLTYSLKRTATVNQYTLTLITKPKDTTRNVTDETYSVAYQPEEAKSGLTNRTDKARITLSGGSISGTFVKQ
jgi:hypothetical protein